MKRNPHTAEVVLVRLANGNDSNAEGALDIHPDEKNLFDGFFGEFESRSMSL